MPVKKNTALAPKSTLQILNETLGITELIPDGHGWTNRFDIPSESGDKTYRIAQRSKSKEWGCSCKGWIFHHSKPGFTGCKHLKALRPVLNQIEEAQGTGLTQNPAIAKAHKFLYQGS